MAKKKIQMKIIYNPLFKKIQIGKVDTDKPGVWFGDPVDVTSDCINAVYKLFDEFQKETNKKRKYSDIQLLDKGFCAGRSKIKWHDFIKEFNVENAGG